MNAVEAEGSLAGAVARLSLRTCTTGLLWSFHAWHKLANFQLEASAFPDPFGVGPTTSLLLALSVESFCGLLVAVGLFTRLACLPIVATMLVVLQLALSGDDNADVQAACLYALIYGAIALFGPGRFSLDHLLGELRVSARGALPAERVASE